MCDDLSHIRLGPSPQFLDEIDRQGQKQVDALLERARKELENMRTRCKVRVESVRLYGSDGNGNHTQEEIQMRAVSGNKVKNGYPDDGSDEDNTYAKFSPSADFRLLVANPSLFGQFKPEQKFYIDMTPAES